MFLSTQHLTQNFGLDADVASFFVDRKVPENNLYWKGKYLYMRHHAGFLFIPLFCDILLRTGVPKERVLGDAFVETFEEILNSAAKEEFGLQTEEAHHDYCHQLVLGRSVPGNQWLPLILDNSGNWKTETPYRPDSEALRRADAFLLSLALLDIPEAKQASVLRYWYALVGFFLLMDDVDDYEKDKRENEVNALIEWKEEGGVQKIEHFMEQCISSLEEINPRLSYYCGVIIQKFEIHERLAALAAG